MPKALVTGGAGFIGSHIVDRLVREGYEVAVLDDFSSGSGKNLENSIESIKLFEGDILDEGMAEKAAFGCECVFHDAAFVSAAESVSNPEKCNEINAQGTLNMLNAARNANARRFVFSSSSAVYGNLQGTAGEKSETKPVSPYGQSKLDAEKQCAEFAKKHGLSTVALRYFNVYGQRQNPDSQYAAVIPKFISAAKKGKQLTVFGDGEQTRDFIYISDVVEANMLAAKSGYSGAVNVASGKTISINELAKKITAIAGSKSEIVHADEREGDIRNSSADVKLARKVLGFAAKTGLDEGLRKILG